MTTTNTNTVTVKASRYTDHDDCLAAAELDYISSHPELSGWDLSPRWQDDDRDVIVLTVPDFSQDLDTQDLDAQCPEHGCSRSRCDSDHNTETAQAIASNWGARFVRSSEDASWATDAAVPRGDAENLVAALERAGLEASAAVDYTDLSKAWVYVTVA